MYSTPRDSVSGISGRDEANADRHGADMNTALVEQLPDAVADRWQSTVPSTGQDLPALLAHARAGTPSVTDTDAGTGSSTTALSPAPSQDHARSFALTTTPQSPAQTAGNFSAVDAPGAPATGNISPPTAANPSRRASGGMSGVYPSRDELALDLPQMDAETKRSTNTTPSVRHASPVGGAGGDQVLSRTPPRPMLREHSDGDVDSLRQASSVTNMTDDEELHSASHAPDWMNRFDPPLGESYTEMARNAKERQANPKAGGRKSLAARRPSGLLNTRLSPSNSDKDKPPRRSNGVSGVSSQGHAAISIVPQHSTSGAVRTMSDDGQHRRYLLKWQKLWFISALVSLGVSLLFTVLLITVITAGTWTHSSFTVRWFANSSRTCVALIEPCVAVQNALSWRWRLQSFEALQTGNRTQDRLYTDAKVFYAQQGNVGYQRSYLDAPRHSHMIPHLRRCFEWSHCESSRRAGSRWLSTADRKSFCACTAVNDQPIHTAPHGRLCSRLDHCYHVFFSPL